MATIMCPVCKRQIRVEWPQDRGVFEEFIVMHGDHVFKAYVDKEGFLRRAWPVRLLHATDAEVSDAARLRGPSKV